MAMKKKTKPGKYRLNISLKSKVVTGKKRAENMKKALKKKLKGAKVTIKKA